MWDNVLTKRNPKAPDFKCRDRLCDGVVWPPKNGTPPHAAAPAAPASTVKQPYSAGPLVPGIDGSPLAFDTIDKICAASQTFLRHVITSELPELTKAEIGASDDYVHSRVANLLITAERAGVFR